LKTLNKKTKNPVTKIKIDEIISLIQPPAKNAKLTDDNLVDLAKRKTMDLTEVLGEGVQPVDLTAFPYCLWKVSMFAKLPKPYFEDLGVPVDTAIGIVASTLFAIGVAVVSSSRDRRLNSANLLFGNVLGVDTEDIILVALVTVIAAIVLFRNYKTLLAVTHNSAVAAAHGVRAHLMEVVFSALLAMVVVTALRVLGVLLVAATLLIPAATATMTFKTFRNITIASICLGTSFAIIGLFLSIHRNIASGPAIVLVGATVFVMNMLTSTTSQRNRA
jgi:ABC-type Mn2+/Zn2+ transport system permease subunit